MVRWIGRRAFDLLCALLDGVGEVVTKDALFAAVWPGVIVEVNALQVHISARRKALPPDMIATVHGRGYRHAGPVPEPVRTVASPVSGRPRAVKGPVIVVLPFANLGGDPTQQYFSDGITGDITDRLWPFRKFAVIGQYSASAFRGAVPDLTAIRDRLKADFAVTCRKLGALRLSGKNGNQNQSFSMKSRAT